jgi:tetratricopeptide (TPR) repeat protein
MRRALAWSLTARAIAVAAAALSLAAGVEMSRQLRGDKIVYELPVAHDRMAPDRAAAFEVRIRDGLRLHARSPDARVRRAGYLTVMERREEAYAELEAARRYGTGVSGYLLEASTHEKTGEIPLARAAFERLHRISPTDRSIVQHLLKTYSDGRDDERLRDLATRAEMRWPVSFDQSIALAHSYIAEIDAELVLKLYLLAENAPNARSNAPEPRIFRADELRHSIDEAVEYLDYRAGWARRR